MWSMVTEALSRMPRKRPTWTKTRVTAKATPAIVIAERSLSCSRFLSARFGTAQALAPFRRFLAAEAAARSRGAGRRMPRIETSMHRLDRALLRPPVDPRLVALGHPQGDPAVDRRPDDLGDELGVVELRAQQPLRDRLADRPQDEGVGVLVAVADLDHALLRGVRRVRRHEHQPVVVRVAQREVGVGEARRPAGARSDRRPRRSCGSGVASLRKSVSQIALMTASLSRKWR